MVIIRTLIFTLVVPGSVAAWIPYLLVSSGPRVFSYPIGLYRLIGILPMALGAAAYLWCARDFVFAGKGTPAPWDPPRHVVSRGLYRMTRNPMYLGVGLILIGEDLFFASLLLLAYAALIWGLLHLVVGYYEEPTLRQKFGTSYEAYSRAVPRWIPRLRRSGGEE